MPYDSFPLLFNTDQTSLGCWIKTPSSMAVELAARTGFDYLCLDMQHGLVTKEDLVPLLTAARPEAARTLVRVPSNETGIIGWVLDAGATGVIVPMVNSAAEAQAAVAACRYSPVGIRSVGPTRAATIYGPAYMDQVIERVQCLPMIETTSALHALDDILSVEGVDAIYVGPSDLSTSLGLGPGNHDGESPFDEALDTIVAACKRHGVVPGIHANTALAARRFEQGFKVVTIVEDLGSLDTSFAGALNELADRQ